MDFEQMLSEHSKWLKGEGGKKLVIENANMSGTNMSYADMRNADMRNANMSGALMSGANMSYADMSGANMSYADMRNALMSGTNMSYADMRNANMSYADMRNVHMSGADMRNANISCASGIEPQHVWIKSNLERTDDGYVCYKTFGEHFTPNANWSVEEGALITENVNFDRCNCCACGINVCTLEFVIKYTNKEDIWECLIPFDGLAGVCVPYNTDGRFRCEMVKLIKKHTREELVKKSRKAKLWKESRGY